MIEVFNQRAELPQFSSSRVRFCTPPLYCVAPVPVDGTFPAMIAALTVSDVEAVGMPPPDATPRLAESDQAGERMVNASQITEQGAVPVTLVEVRFVLEGQLYRPEIYSGLMVPKVRPGIW